MYRLELGHRRPFLVAAVRRKSRETHIPRPNRRLEVYLGQIVGIAELALRREGHRYRDQFPGKGGERLPVEGGRGLQNDLPESGGR